MEKCKCFILAFSRKEFLKWYMRPRLHIGIRWKGKLRRRFSPQVFISKARRWSHGRSKLLMQYIYVMFIISSTCQTSCITTIRTKIHAHILHAKKKKILTNACPSHDFCAKPRSAPHTHVTATINMKEVSLHNSLTFEKNSFSFLPSTWSQQLRLVL